MVCRYSLADLLETDGVPEAVRVAAFHRLDRVEASLVAIGGLGHQRAAKWVPRQ